MVEALVVKSKVGDYIKGKNMRMSGDAYDKLSEVVQKKLDMAIWRSKENGRSTVKPSDL